MRAARKLLLAVIGAAVLNPSASAQEPLLPRRGLFISGYAGGTASSDFRRGLVAPSQEGTADAMPFRVERRVSAEEAPVFGLSLTYWRSADWGLRLHGSYAPSQFEVQVDEEPEPGRQTLPREDAPLTLWMTDLSVVFRIHVPSRRFAPYAILGGGAVRYAAKGADPAEIPDEALTVFAQGRRRIRPAAVAGVGALVPLGGSDLALAFEITDHFGGTPLPRQGGEADHDPAEDSIRVTHNIRFVVGFTLALTGVVSRR